MTKGIPADESIHLHTRKSLFNNVSRVSKHGSNSSLYLQIQRGAVQRNIHEKAPKLLRNKVSSALFELGVPRVYRGFSTNFISCPRYQHSVTEKLDTNSSNDFIRYKYINLWKSIIKNRERRKHNLPDL